MAAISKTADRLLCRYGDRLLGGLRQRDGRHAPQRRRAGASNPRKSCLRHRFRHQPQRRTVRSFAAFGRNQHGGAGDQPGHQAAAATDSVRPCRDGPAFWRDPGIRFQRKTGRRCFDARSAAGRPRQRGVFHGSPRSTGCGPVHQPADAASRRLRHRAQPPHHGRRWPLPRRGRRLDPVFLFSRPVRPAAS